MVYSKGMVVVLITATMWQCTRGGTDNPTEIGCWSFRATTGTTIPNECASGSSGHFDPTGAALIDLGAASNHTGALQLFGNFTGGGGGPFAVPHSSALDKLDEFTLAFWLDWW
jgi:hypothetical protein